MSAEPVVLPEDEFDPERNRTIARVKAGLDPKLRKGLGGVPPATPEQLERWEREEREQSPIETFPGRRRSEDREEEERFAVERRRAEQNGSGSRPFIAAAPKETAAAAINQSPDFEARPLDPRRFRPVTFGWTQRLVRGVINVFGGEEGVGKGTLEAKAIADFTRGRLPGVFEGKPVRVLWLGDEDSVDRTVGPRLHAAGVDFDYVEEVHSRSDALLNVTTQADALERLLKAGKFAVVVFEQLLDNLPSMRNPNDPQEVRAALRPLRALLRRCETIGLATLHVNKGHPPDFRSALPGSHQFNALSRSSMLVGWHPDGAGRRVLIGGKANYSALATPLSFEIQIREFDINGHHFEEPLACEFHEEAGLTIEAVLRGPSDARREQERQNEEQRLLVALAESPGATATDVADALGIAYRTASDRLTEAFEAGRVRREGAGKRGDPHRWFIAASAEP